MNPDHIVVSIERPDSLERYVTRDGEYDLTVTKEGVLALRLDDRTIFYPPGQWGRAESRIRADYNLADDLTDAES